MEPVTITISEASGVEDLEAAGIAMMTHKQVQKRLNVNEKTVDRLIASNQLPAMKVGSEWRIPIAGYKKYVAQRMAAQK